MDTAEGLASAAEHFMSGPPVVGIDCEWKANREKGREENKASDDQSYAVITLVTCIS